MCLQVENEFGFVGPNEKYIKHLVGTVRTVLGNDFIIYTTDPPPNIAKGSLAGDSVYRYQCHACPDPLRSLSIQIKPSATSWAVASSDTLFTSRTLSFAHLLP